MNISKSNLIILWTKHYIWANKFRNTHPSLLAFKVILGNRLREFKELCEIDKEYEKQFFEWLPVYNYLNAGE